MTAKRMEIDRYCLRRNCSPLNALFGNVYVTLISHGSASSVDDLARIADNSRLTSSVVTCENGDSIGPTLGLVANWRRVDDLSAEARFAWILLTLSVKNWLKVDTSFWQSESSCDTLWSMCSRLRATRQVDSHHRIRHRVSIWCHQLAFSGYCREPRGTPAGKHVDRTHEPVRRYRRLSRRRFCLACLASSERWRMSYWPRRRRRVNSGACESSTLHAVPHYRRARRTRRRPSSCCHTASSTGCRGRKPRCRSCVSDRSCMSAWRAVWVARRDDTWVYGGRRSRPTWRTAETPFCCWRRRHVTRSGRGCWRRHGLVWWRAVAVRVAGTHQ